MTDFQELLDKLNPQQRAAVTTVDGPLLVIAGAGSGKTRVITHRIAYLLRERGAAPWEIFAATFTNKAAEEMRARVGRLLPGADIGRLAISTFHSLCVGILRREAEHLGLTHRFTICDDTDQLGLIKDCMRALSVETKLKPDQVRHYIATAKIQMLEPEEARTTLGGEYGDICAHVYRVYQERLLSNDAVDFDDLILHVVRLFQKNPAVLTKYQERWRWLLVDEYQDTNRVQFELVKLLAASHGNLCAVGDEDQSIYSWRGAEIENLLKFPELFPGTQLIRLEQNYRSKSMILRAAGAVIGHNSQRLGKELWSERGEGEPVTMICGYSERDEAAQVVDTIAFLNRVQGRRLNDIAIFYRVNALSRVFEDQMRQRGIPYRVIGGIKFYDRAEVKDLLAYLRLAVNARDGVALARVINKPPRGIGDKSMATLFNEAVAAGISLWDKLAQVAAAEQPGISKKARAGIALLVHQIAQWKEYAEVHAPHEVLEYILRDVDYETYLGDGDDLESISRRENVSELVTALEEFYEASPSATLDEFLERVALVSATDDVRDDEAVSLMSLHCAKGLEYGAVFLVGMEDPIFPSQRAVADQGHFEEERRLFYVGITRAKDLLFLSRADSRSFRGRSSYNLPSIFLREVPSELMRSLEDARRQWSEAASGEQRRRRESAPAEQRDSHAGRLGPRIGQGSVVDVAASAGEGATGGGTGRFSVGERVAHARLGEGEVLRASGHGAARKVLVRFDAGLELEILESFGGLVPVESSELPY